MSSRQHHLTNNSDHKATINNRPGAFQIARWDDSFATALDRLSRPEMIVSVDKPEPGIKPLKVVWSSLYATKIRC